MRSAARVRYATLGPGSIAFFASASPARSEVRNERLIRCTHLEASDDFENQPNLVSPLFLRTEYGNTENLQNSTHLRYLRMHGDIYSFSQTAERSDGAKCSNAQKILFNP